LLQISSDHVAFICCSLIDACASSKEQEKQSFSIPAQLNFFKEYAATQGSKVAQEYAGIETVKATSAVALRKIINYHDAHPLIRRSW
jgi:hypothetical protein